MLNLEAVNKWSIQGGTMKLCLLMLMASCLALCSIAYAQDRGEDQARRLEAYLEHPTLLHRAGDADHAPDVAECFEAYSGATAVDCLKGIDEENQRTIAVEEIKIHATLTALWYNYDLIDGYYVGAVSSLMSASEAFTNFSQRQCSFANSASGAAGSGWAQVYYKCLIRLADWRIQYLNDEYLSLLKRMEDYRKYNSSSRDRQN
jgi:hypothetical protein